MYELSFKKMSEIKPRWGMHERGVSTVCSAVYIRREKKRDKCEECGRTKSRSTDHHWIIIG